jgi:hypothetical protein
MINFRNLGFLKNVTFSFSNKKILSIFLLIVSIIISIYVSNNANRSTYLNPIEINEGMLDCSGNNIIYSILNDNGPLPYQKLNTIREFISSFNEDSQLNSVKIMEILNSQTDSDVVKVDKLKKKLEDLDLCTNTKDDEEYKKKSKK